METTINIAEILKDKPECTKLYSPLFGDVYLLGVEAGIIRVKRYRENETPATFYTFYRNGKYFSYPESEPLLFPSKKMKKWSKFAWKKGDVLKNTATGQRVIFDRFLTNNYTYFVGKHSLDCSNKNKIIYHDECSCFTGNYRLESEEVAQTYINTIKEKLGGKLNLETLEIEKSAFKDGDIVVYGKSVAICRKFYKHTLCFYVSLNEMFGLLFDDEVESSEEYRFATEEEKQQLFDSLAKEGKAWDAEKKLIVDLKPKIEFKPFDKVLVRDCLDEMWRPSFFACYLPFGKEPYQVIGGEWVKLCIPYEGNESLLGTTKDVEG